MCVLALLGMPVVLGLLGCSSEVTNPNAPAPVLSRLYSRIHETRHDYEKGIELIASGHPVLGKNLLDSTTDQMRTLAEECRITPDCDSGIFVDALGHVYMDRRYPAPEELAATIPEIERSLTLINGTDMREMIRLNTRVQGALNDWLTWNRPELITAYENYQYLREKIAPIYVEAGLPEALLFAIMAKETGGKVHAYSRAGAAGPLQFMPATARRYRLGSIDGFDMRLDPAAATRASVAYINDQLRDLNDNLEKVLAAYNSGESRLRRLHRKHVGAQFWDPQIYYALPRETRHYVPQVLAAAWLFLNPDAYGLDFPHHENNLATMTLAEPASLGELAICLEQDYNPRGWFRTLRNLNPRIDPGDRIEAGKKIEIPAVLVPIYAERCVGDGPLVSLARQLHDAQYNSKPETTVYHVKSGDTLAAISASHSCSMRQVASLNNIRAPRYIVHVGQKLTIPHCRGA